MRTAFNARLDVIALVVLSFCCCGQALADDKQDCQAAAGELITGQVASKPKFKSGQFRKGVELSHTHVIIKSDADGKKYDVAIDNVFAAGYKKHSKGIPAPLNAIAVGDHLEVCGEPFPGGIHFVHTNCGDKPTPKEPDGWVKKLSADGSAGSNLEDSRTFCGLWPHHH